MATRIEFVDKKITVDEANRLMGSMELDLMAFFKVLENDILKALENYKGDDPQEIINEALGFLNEVEGQTVEKTTRELKTDLFDRLNNTLEQFKDRGSDKRNN